MNASAYLDTLEEPAKTIFSTFREIIISTDKTVTESVGKAMGGGPSLCYNQDGVFKYCLAVTKSHLSFHSMVMYANPALMDALKAQLDRVKFQKGCINFKSPEQFPADVFLKHMQASAKTDFSSVINHYKAKAKK